MLTTEIIDKKQQIVVAAQRLFSQFGLKKVTTEDISREAGVSKATVYRHFKNKSEIFDEVVWQESEQLLARIKVEVDSAHTVYDRLRAHLMVRLGRVQEFVNFYRVTQGAWGDYWPRIDEVRNSFLDQEAEVVQRVIEAGIEKGDLAVHRPALAARLMVVSLTSVAIPSEDGTKGISLELFIDTMLDILLHGIRKR